MEYLSPGLKCGGSGPAFLPWVKPSDKPTTLKAVAERAGPDGDRTDCDAATEPTAERCLANCRPESHHSFADLGVAGWEADAPDINHSRTRGKNGGLFAQGKENALAGDEP